MDKLKSSWEFLMGMITIDITFLKFTEGIYDENWDEGAATYPEYTLPSRVKFELTSRDIESLGENLLLDAIAIIRKKDLDALVLDLASQDRFRILDKLYRITKVRPIIIAGEHLGYEVGLREVMP